MSLPQYEPESIAGFRTVEEGLYYLTRQIEWPPGWLTASGVLNLHLLNNTTLRDGLLQLQVVGIANRAMREMHTNSTNAFIDSLNEVVLNIGRAWLRLADLGRQKVSDLKSTARPIIVDLSHQLSQLNDSFECFMGALSLREEAQFKTTVERFVREAEERAREAARLGIVY